MNIFAIVGEDGYISGITDSNDYMLKGAVLLDRENYYSFFGDQINYCRISKKIRIEKIFLEDKSETEVEWHYAELDEKKYQAHYDKLVQSEITERRAVEDEKSKAAILQRALLQTSSLLLTASQYITDEEAKIMPEKMVQWEAGQTYQKDMIIRHEDRLYRIVQEGVTSQPHQVPGGDGMLAVYRPLSSNESVVDGSLQSPFELTMGMDTVTGFYYIYGGKKYLAIQDAKPCIWDPAVVPALFSQMNQVDTNDPAPSTEFKVPTELDAPVTSEAGTKENPIVYQDRMKIETGKHYSYQDKTYEALQNVEVCVWYPGQVGVHFFKLVNI